MLDAFGTVTNKHEKEKIQGQIFNSKYAFS